MVYKDEVCPRCGNVARGQLAPHGGREFTKTFGKKIAKEGVMEVANSIASIDPILGMGAAAVGIFASHRAIDSAQDKIGDVFAFECPRCGQTWQSKGRPPMPIELIAKVKDEYIHELKNDRPVGAAITFTILAIVCGIICFICFIILCTGSSYAFDTLATTLYFLIFFGAGIPFMILAITKNKKISSMKQELEVCEFQDLYTFKETHPRLFSKYNQYS